MWSRLKDWWADKREMFCRHEWDKQEAKRFCRKCGREEWIFRNRLLVIGQPQYVWKRMGPFRGNF